MDGINVMRPWLSHSMLDFRDLLSIGRLEQLWGWVVARHRVLVAGRRRPGLGGASETGGDGGFM